MNRFIQPATAFVFAIAFSSAAAAGPYATPTKDTDKAKSCITLSQLESTEVVDSRNILFHMRDGTIYRNHLAHDCQGLDYEQRFVYRNNIGQLCDLDVITILFDTIFGFDHGPSCGLGAFYPISEEKAQKLKEHADLD